MSSIENEARAEAERVYPEITSAVRARQVVEVWAVRQMSQNAYKRGYVAGASRAVTDAEVEAVARHMQPALFSEAGEGEVFESVRRAHARQSLVVAKVRAVLEAAREVNRG